MHKIYFPCIIILLLSCEGIFHEENGLVVIDTEQEKIDRLNGIYYHLTQVHTDDYFYMMSRADDVNYYFNYSFEMPGFAKCENRGPWKSISQIKEEIYFNLYKAILNANDLITKLDATHDKALVGEAYFLRAYCFFKLARFFGRPPLVTDIDVDYLKEKPGYIEVYELIESDLLQALERLPENYSESRISRETPNQGSAKALLAEVYLSMAGYPVADVEKYTESARLAGEVIEQAEFYNYSLLADFADLWKGTNRHNSEIIFGLYFSGNSYATRNGIGANFVTRFTDREFRMAGTYNPEFKFLDDFPFNHRKIKSVAIGEYVAANYDTLTGVEHSSYYYLFDPFYDPCAFLQGAVYYKWLDVDKATKDLGSEFSPDLDNLSLYLLRYAQTLLTYAEAKARAGELDASCYEAVNKVRRRANKLDIYSPSEFDLVTGLTREQFLDSVVWERAWELCYEPDGRWFDIIRLDLRQKLAEFRYDFDKPTIIADDMLTEDWYFYLIPQEDRWLNPNYGEDFD